MPFARIRRRLELVKSMHPETRKKIGRASRIALAVILVAGCLGVGVGIRTLLRSSDPEIRLTTMGIILVILLGWAMFRIVRPRSDDRDAAATPWWTPWWLDVPAIFAARRHESWEHGASERRERIARRADNSAHVGETPATTIDETLPPSEGA
jgi:hypothetical protein